MNEQKSRKFSLNDDWWAVIVAGLLIILSVLGVLGEHGLKITF